MKIVMVTTQIVMATAQTGKVLGFWDASTIETMSWSKIILFPGLTRSLFLTQSTHRGLLGIIKSGRLHHKNGLGLILC